MVQAIWNGVVIAESDDTVVVDGNHYFSRSAVKDDVVRPSEHHSICGWKGEASYYSIEAGGEINVDAAWYYPKTKPAAANIEGRVAFWKGVQVK